MEAAPGWCQSPARCSEAWREQLFMILVFGASCASRSWQQVLWCDHKSAREVFAEASSSLKARAREGMSSLTVELRFICTGMTAEHAAVRGTLLSLQMRALERKDSRGIPKRS